MNLSGIRASSAFYHNNRLKNEEKLKHHSQEKKQDNSGLPQKNTAALQNPQKTRDAAPSLKSCYGQELPCSLKGTDSDLAALDIGKVLSDIKKDEVLKQYQFFIGDSAPVQPASEIEQQKNRLQNFSCRS